MLVIFLYKKYQTADDGFKDMVFDFLIRWCGCCANRNELSSIGNDPQLERCAVADLGSRLSSRDYEESQLSSERDDQRGLDQHYPRCDDSCVSHATSIHDTGTDSVLQAKEVPQLRAAPQRARNTLQRAPIRLTRVDVVDGRQMRLSSADFSFLVEELRYYRTNDNGNPSMGSSDDSSERSTDNSGSSMSESSSSSASETATPQLDGQSNMRSDQPAWTHTTSSASTSSPSEESSETSTHTSSQPSAQVRQRPINRLPVSQMQVENSSDFSLGSTTASTATTGETADYTTETIVSPFESKMTSQPVSRYDGSSCYKFDYFSSEDTSLQSRSRVSRQQLTKLVAGNSRVIPVSTIVTVPLPNLNNIRQTEPRPIDHKGAHTAEYQKEIQMDSRSRNPYEGPQVIHLNNIPRVVMKLRTPTTHAPLLKSELHSQVNAVHTNLESDKQRGDKQSSPLPKPTNRQKHSHSPKRRKSATASEASMSPTEIFETRRVAVNSAYQSLCESSLRLFGTPTPPLTPKATVYEGPLHLTHILNAIQSSSNKMYDENTPNTAAVPQHAVQSDMYRILSPMIAQIKLFPGEHDTLSSGASSAANVSLAAGNTALSAPLPPSHTCQPRFAAVVPNSSWPYLFNSELSISASGDTDDDDDAENVILSVVRESEGSATKK